VQLAWIAFQNTTLGIVAMPRGPMNEFAGGSVCAAASVAATRTRVTKTMPTLVVMLLTPVVGSGGRWMLGQ